MITPDTLKVPTIEDATKLLARAEFRDCGNWQERAVLLRTSFGVHPDVIMRVLNRSRSSVYAVLKKAKEGDQFRKRGRPSLLDSAENGELVDEILEREKKKLSVYPAEIASLVRIYRFMFGCYGLTCCRRRRRSRIGCNASTRLPLPPLSSLASGPTRSSGTMARC